jgi:hypothetical protein
MSVTLTDAEVTQVMAVLADWRSTHAAVSAFPPDLQTALTKLGLPAQPRQVTSGINTPATSPTVMPVKGKDRN